MWVVSAGLVRMCRCCLNRQQFRGSDWQLWMSISLIVTGCYRPIAVIRFLHKPGLFTSGLGGEWRVSVTVTLGLHTIDEIPNEHCWQRA